MFKNLLLAILLYICEKYTWIEISVPIMLSLLNIKPFTIKLLVVDSLSELYKTSRILISNY